MNKGSIRVKDAIWWYDSDKAKVFNFPKKNSAKIFNSNIFMTNFFFVNNSCMKRMIKAAQVLYNPIGQIKSGVVEALNFVG